MKENNLNSFYFNLLNINKNNDTINDIKKIINNINNYLEINKLDKTMFCKVLSNLLHNELKDKRIFNKIVNTNDLFNCYEHEFILASYDENDTIKYILIDMAYEQFVKKDNRTLITLNEFPSELITNKELLNNILENNFSIIDENDFQEYLYSIHQNKELINLVKLEDIMFQNKKTK